MTGDRMVQVRLLERLRAHGYGENAHGVEYENVVQSILSHVHNVLCTRNGTVLIDEDYGMPDVFFSQGIRFRESTSRMSNAIVSVIRKFEPRLKNVTIVQLSDKEDLLMQKFGVKGYLTDASALGIEFIVTISSEAKITVSRKQQD
jgi:type VI secretion system protein